MLEKEPTHFHHFALELRDLGELRLLLDHLAKHGRWVIWGPGRHGVAASIFAYIRIPEEEPDRRALLRHGAALAPIMCHATGRTRPTPRMSGGRFRRGPTSASTPRRSRLERGPAPGTRAGARLTARALAALLVARGDACRPGRRHPNLAERIADAVEFAQGRAGSVSFAFTTDPVVSAATGPAAVPSASVVKAMLLVSPT